MTRGQGHPHVSAERQPDDDRPAVVGLIRNELGDPVGGAVDGEGLGGGRAVADEVGGEAVELWLEGRDLGGPGRAGQAGAMEKMIVGRGSVMHQLALDGVERGLGPALEIELAEDVRDVGPGRSLGDPELGRDLLVAPAVTDEAEDLQLAVRQRLDRLALGPRAHALGEDPRGSGIEMDLVVVGRPDRGRDVIRLGVLEDEPAGTGLERGEDLLLLDERGQRDDLDRRLGRLDPGRSPRCRRAAA
jgi:hypothetical protein